MVWEVDNDIETASDEISSEFTGISIYCLEEKSFLPCMHAFNHPRVERYLHFAFCFPPRNPFYAIHIKDQCQCKKKRQR
jgi:hypothetical protein